MSNELQRIEASELVAQGTLPADRHPAKVYIASLAPGSRRTMRSALDTIAWQMTDGKCDAETFAWGALRYQHTAAIRSLLAEVYAVGSANKMLSALRGVLKEAWRLGYMTAEEYHRAVDVKSVRGSKVPQGRALSSGEITALFRVCQADETAAGTRDAALLAVLCGAGLRRSEVVGLNVEDYNPDTGELRIHGKGNKERLGYATNGGAMALEDWLKIRGTEPGPLFYPVNKGGKATPRRMTDQSVLWILRKRAEQAGVKQFTPHDLRRTFISEILDATGDVSAAQQLAGHANPATTTAYDRRGERAKRRAVELLHVPYTGR